MLPSCVRERARETGVDPSARYDGVAADGVVVTDAALGRRRLRKSSSFPGTGGAGTSLLLPKLLTLPPPLLLLPLLCSRLCLLTGGVVAADGVVAVVVDWASSSRRTSLSWECSTDPWLVVRRGSLPFVGVASFCLVALLSRGKGGAAPLALAPPPFVSCCPPIPFALTDGPNKLLIAVFVELCLE